MARKRKGKLVWSRRHGMYCRVIRRRGKRLVQCPTFKAMRRRRKWRR